MIIPGFARKRGGYLNLGDYARGWIAREFPEKEFAVSPTNDPAVCARMLAQAEGEKGLEWSYGGWLEDRTALWKGNYLEAKKNYLHLGVDVNAPAGSTVFIDLAGRVIRTGNDQSAGGWGGFVIMELALHGILLLYGHLDAEGSFFTSLREGRMLDAQTAIGRIAPPERNGGWYPHTHVQAIHIETYIDRYERNFDALDGYGRQEDLNRLSMEFPDPMPFIVVCNGSHY